MSESWWRGFSATTCAVVGIGLVSEGKWLLGVAALALMVLYVVRELRAKS